MFEIQQDVLAVVARSQQVAFKLDARATREASVDDEFDYGGPTGRG